MFAEREFQALGGADLRYHMNLEHLLAIQSVGTVFFQEPACFLYELECFSLFLSVVVYDHLKFLRSLFVVDQAVLAIGKFNIVVLKDVNNFPLVLPTDLHREFFLHRTKCLSHCEQVSDVDVGVQKEV